MNLVRIFVNATWWTNNVQVPLANQTYRTYIDGLIQRAEKYGNYVLIVKDGQFPRSPLRRHRRVPQAEPGRPELPSQFLALRRTVH